MFVCLLYNYLYTYYRVCGYSIYPESRVIVFPACTSLFVSFYFSSFQPSDSRRLHNIHVIRINIYRSYNNILFSIQSEANNVLVFIRRKCCFFFLHANPRKQNLRSKNSPNRKIKH